jgi:hypothetical protein
MKKPRVENLVTLTLKVILQSLSAKMKLEIFCSYLLYSARSKIVLARSVSVKHVDKL